MSDFISTDMGAWGTQASLDAPESIEIMNLDEGEHTVFIAPPVHASNPFPFLSWKTHFGLGNDGKSVITNLSGLIENPVVKDILGDRWESVREAQQILGSHLASRSSERDIQGKPRYYFLVIPQSFKSPTAKSAQNLPPQFAFLAGGKSVFNGIKDIFMDEGNIADPTKGIFVKIKRSGSGLNTEYRVTVDSASLRSPVDLTKNEAIEGMFKASFRPDGPASLYTLATRFAKDVSQMNEALGLSSSSSAQGWGDPSDSMPY
jgi:hypothetical protein